MIKNNMRKTKQALQIEELKEIWMQTGTEIGDRGLFWKVKENLHALGGSIDKNAEMLDKFTKIIQSL